MKFKLIVLSLLMAASTNFVNAQDNSGKNLSGENRHEFRLSVSDGLTLGSSGILGDGLTDAILGSKRSDSKTSMLFGFGYCYSINRFRVGADLGFLQASSKVTLSGETAPSIKDKGLNFLILPTAEFTYFKRGLVELYGGASVGVDLVRQTQTPLSADRKNEKMKNKNDFSAFVAYQVNPIAVRVGNDRIGGFIEAGFGYKGFATAGVSLKF